jgi:hypothetical protein|uniref:Transmembrane protein n=1 Tax=viral metagenome TaxID=1070528 RepID=A0A6C0IQJ1_9ZZZZ
MEGSVVLNIEEEITEKKAPILIDGRITESFEIQIDQIDKEVEKKLQEIARKKHDNCKDNKDDAIYCIKVISCFGLAFLSLYLIILYRTNNQ